MATARFEQATYTFNRIVNGESVQKTVYLKYILCNDNDIVIRQITPLQGINQLNYYGINGTFFDSGSNNLTAISIYNGASIRDYGYQNGGAVPHEMGTYVKFKTKVENMRAFVDQVDVYEGHVYNGITMHTSDVLWAVGGVSLYTSDQTLTETAFYNRISSEVDSSVRIDGYAPRTAIVYIGGPVSGLNTVLLTVHDSAGDDTGHTGTFVTGNGTDKGVTMWELRNLINDYFGSLASTPTTNLHLAIALDGGGSTCIRAKDANSNNVVYSSIIDSSNRTRMMRSLITVDM